MIQYGLRKTFILRMILPYRTYGHDIVNVFLTYFDTGRLKTFISITASGEKAISVLEGENYRL
jgi:hypothetical protein